MESNKIVIDFEPISRRVLYSPEKTIYNFIKSLNIHTSFLCGGLGTCGKCKLLIQKGVEYLTHPSEKEKRFLNYDELKKGWRLACQTKVNEEFLKNLENSVQPQFRIFLPEDLLLEDFNILTSGVKPEVKFSPTIKKMYLQVEKPSIKNPIPDLERIISSILSIDKSFNKDNPIEFDDDLINRIPNVLRETNSITLTLWKNSKILSIEPGEKVKENFGIAFDIGTTTIVGYLINLNDGKTYSVASKLNPQTAYGEDVITRLTYIRDNEQGLQQLNSCLIESLNEIIIENCSNVNVNPSQIYEATIVGNSVMHHIFLKLNPINIGLSPYIPILQRGLNVKPKDLNLNIYSQGNVYTLPIIAGFVGADTMGVILSSNIEKEKELTLVIDIGTNGEIILGNHKFLATASCAAGSALEGAHIYDGMRAAAGAIDTIKIEPKSLKTSYTTINNKKPIGICGSGLIDAVAEMLRSKILNRNGSFNKKFLNHQRFNRNNDKTAFIIAKKEETNLEKEITISQNDIRQIQMAKAAFYSGTRIMLKYVNNNKLSKNEIKQIFLAGAFGNYINKENARFIGMIPDIPNDNIFQIGNAAGIGAQICLLSSVLREKTDKILKKIKYIEIATKKEFQKEFAEAMYFPHLKLDQFPSLKEYIDIPLR